MKLVETNAAQRIETLGGNSYLTDISEALLKEVAGNMQLREYARGDVLF